MKPLFQIGLQLNKYVLIEELCLSEEQKCFVLFCCQDRTEVKLLFQLGCMSCFTQRDDDDDDNDKQPTTGYKPSPSPQAQSCSASHCCHVRNKSGPSSSNTKLHFPYWLLNNSVSVRQWAFNYHLTQIYVSLLRAVHFLVNWSHLFQSPLKTTRVTSPSSLLQFGWLCPRLHSELGFTELNPREKENVEHV